MEGKMAAELEVSKEENGICTNGHKYAEDSKAVKNYRSKKKRRGCSEWCLKYFWEGQNLDKSHAEAIENLDHAAPWYEKLVLKYRRPLALLTPALVFHFFWWSFMIQHNLFYLYKEKYFMAVTMVFGSMIAGMTSEGGGAVAFPVMTLAFHIAPEIARDFSLMIQSFGMTCASLAILFMRVKLEWLSLVFSSVGGVVGLIIGLHCIDPYLTAPQKKMGFVSIWFSFAFALFLLNCYHKRRTFNRVQNVTLGKITILILTGVMGGIFTSFAGNGLDICTFSILTLFYRISEKVATPTSIILMGINTVVGWFWRACIMGGVSQDAYEFLYICGGVVVIGAPAGSVLGSHFHRLVLAALIYILDTVALISAFVLVPQTPSLIGASVGIIAGGFIFFFIVTHLGNRMLTSIEKDEKRRQIEKDVEMDFSEVEPLQDKTETA